MNFEFEGNTWSGHPEYDKGFKDGQKSKQEEIDKLQKKIDVYINIINEALEGFEDGEFNYCHNKLLDALDENFISKELCK